MSISILPKIGELIREQRHVLLARWRNQVRRLSSARHLKVPALNDHIPQLIEELAAALASQSDEAIAEATLEGSPPIHGRQRLHDGFDIEEIVAEYNALRGCVHDLAEENGVVIHGNDLRILNRVLDEAIGLAVQTYATQLALELKERRDEHLSFVAHDLQAPLQAIAQTVAAVERMIPDDARNQHTEQLLKILRRNIKRLEELVTNVIKENAVTSTGTSDQLQRRVVDLWPLVEHVIHGFQPVTGTASVEIINNVPGDVMVHADAALLARVFQNLISHAIQHSPRASVIVDARERSEDGVVECGVSDNGASLTDDEVNAIEAAGQPDGPAHDRLGLAAAKELVEAHGGTLEATTSDNPGTTIRFTLPARPRGTN